MKNRWRQQRPSAMEINHKDTKHTKAKDEGNLFLVGFVSLLFQMA